MLESLEREGEHNAVDVETAWRDEVFHRVQEIESGAVELEDGPAAMSRLRRRAQERLHLRRP